MSELSDWADDIDGHYIDLDGYPPQHPWQCHDVWSHYLTRVIGGTLADAHAAGDGYTIEVWRQFPHHRPALRTLFTKHHGTHGIRAGDVVFWPTGSPNHPDSHVVVALGPVSPGGTFACVSQNPGPARITRLSAYHAAGYLRPTTDPTGDTMTPQQLEKILAEIRKIPKATIDYGVPRTGTDKDGKPRTGKATLRGLLTSWEHQVGITRRIVEKIHAIVKRSGIDGDTPVG